MATNRSVIAEKMRAAMQARDERVLNGIMLVAVVMGVPESEVEADLNQILGELPPEDRAFWEAPCTCQHGRLN